MVWHVTEAMGGGLATAVHEFVRSTPEYSHHLVGHLRTQHQTGESGPFDGVASAERGGPLGLAALLRDPGDLPAPDVVHVHSAWAGLVARVLLHRHRSRLVYSPHSYYFERTDIPRVAQWAAWGLERLLARATRVVVAVSPYEAELATRLGCDVRFVPNVARLPLRRRVPAPRRAGAVPRLVTVGRVEPQKDPRFFAATVDALRALGTDVEAVWIGAGPPDLEAVLRASGVEVTGWVDRTEVLDEVRAADVYVHTAAWEGNPLTVLEAESLGVPLAVRSIPAMVSLGHPAGNTTPRALAATIAAQLAGDVPTPAPAPAVPARIPVELDRVYAEITAAADLQVAGDRPLSLGA